MKNILLPDVLVRITSLKEQMISAEGETVYAIMVDICTRYPVLKKHLFYENGALKEHFIFTRNGTVITPDTLLEEGSECEVMLAISGGMAGDVLSDEEIQRYVRHISLKEVGRQGQLKLKNARVLIIGVGGLGSPVALYLAASGVGTLGLVDFDVVEATNLQRQVIHGYSTVNTAKVESARHRLNDLNPYIVVNIYNCAFDADNAAEIIGDYDIVVDGTDNFATRYLINEACCRLKKPYVFGSISRFSGQLSVFNLEDGPCYNCLYRGAPPTELAPQGRFSGVIGILPGVIGTLEATEVIKLIIGKGEPLSGRVLRFDALAMVFSELRFTRRHDCPTCSGNTPVSSPAARKHARQYPASSESPPRFIEPAALKALMSGDEDACTLVDVREENELEVCRLPGIISIPLHQLEVRLQELDPRRRLVLVCYSGDRARLAAAQLMAAGFRDVSVLSGGMQRWAAEIDRHMPIY